MRRAFLISALIIPLCLAGQASLQGQVREGYLRMLNPSALYDLTGSWKFMPGDSLEYARKDLDDSNWKTITVPGSWHIHGFEYDGTAWFRMKFSAYGEMAGRDLKIITPYIDHALEIYLNGRLVGSQGKISQEGKLLESNSRNSVFSLNAGFIEHGSNTLAFRIAGLAGIGGFAFAYFHIGDAELVQDSFSRYLIRISFISSIFLFVGAYHLLLYLWRKKEKHYLAFGILAILTGLQQLAIKTVGFWIIDNNWVNLYVNTFVLATYPYFIMDFIQKFTGRKIPWIFNTGKYLSLLLAVILTVIFAGLFFDPASWTPFYGLYWRYAVPSMLLSIFIFMIYCLHISAIAVKEGDFSAKLLVYGITFYLVFMILGMLSYFSMINLDIMFEYGFFGMILSLATALAYKFSQVHNETDRLNTELALKNTELMKIDKIKDDFLANTSHELRTPLNGIIGIAEALSDRLSGSGNERSLENIGLIISSTKRLSNLVNDILDFSKLKNSEIILSVKPVDIRQVTEIVINVSRALVGGKSLEIINDIRDDSTYVLADENRIQQILYNLIGNAIKFTGEGKITISAEPANARAGGRDMLQVAVRDTGIGIPEDKFEDIFKSFAQVEDSIAREYGGTGLGLSITRKLIELHGGAIWVSSKPGAGSTFYFTLPATSAPADTDPAGVHAPISSFIKPIAMPVALHMDITPYPVSTRHTGTGHAITVLAVDDEVINLQVLDNLLGDKGYTVIKAHNGFEALQYLDGNLHPDIVLLDIMMPRMSGYEVCRKIRDRYQPYELPILMLTAKTQIEDIVTSFELGANDYVQKPFDRKELLARITTLVALKRATEQQKKYITVQNEMSIARQILLTTLPEKTPEDPRLDMSILYLPMALVGGDYYDFNESGKSVIGVLLTDVSGHGIPAAIIAGMVKIAFNTLKELSKDPPALINGINSSIKGNFRNQFLTVGYMEINLESGVLAYARAGHLPLYIFRRSSNSIIELKPSGRIIGWKCNIKCGIESIDLIPGDRIIFITDGILEIRNSEGELFGEERMFRFIRDNHELSCEEFSGRLIDKALSWSGKSEGDDDMTLITIDFKGTR